MSEPIRIAAFGASDAGSLGAVLGAVLGALADGATDGELIYSGGIGTLDHLRDLSDLGLDNLGGVIVGRALYENRFSIAEAQSVLGPSG